MSIWYCQLDTVCDYVCCILSNKIIRYAYCEKKTATEGKNEDDRERGVAGNRGKFKNKCKNQYRRTEIDVSRTGESVSVAPNLAVIPHLRRASTKVPVSLYESKHLTF